MKAAAEKLKEELKSLPVIWPYRLSLMLMLRLKKIKDAIVDKLYRQMFSPVLWRHA